MKDDGPARFVDVDRLKVVDLAVVEALGHRLELDYVVLVALLLDIAFSVFGSFLRLWVFEHFFDVHYLMQRDGVHHSFSLDYIQVVFGPNYLSGLPNSVQYFSQNNIIYSRQALDLPIQH